MKSFSAKIFKLDINPCVDVPEKIVNALLEVSGRTNGPIPVRGKLNGNDFIQTVVRYQRAWRLYLNTQMRQDAGIDVGDEARVELEFDPEPRVVPMPSLLSRALAKNREAKLAFQKLSSSRQKEILRYLNSLKSEESVTRNVKKVIRQLLGKKKGFLIRR
jgi:hypothetical protein